MQVPEQEKQPERDSEAVREFYNHFSQARLAAGMRIISNCNSYLIYILAR